MNFAVLILLIAQLALFHLRKQKYQNGNIHRKLRNSTSVILPGASVQYGQLARLNF
jgi:hypothetical protein